MWTFVATRKVRRQRQYCSQIQYSLLVLLVPMMLFLGGGALATKAYTNAPQSQSEQIPTVTQQETYILGETFKIGNLQYKINSVRTADDDINFVKLPGIGKTFLLVNVTIENQGSADAEIRNMIGFKLKDKDGRMQEFSMGAALAVKNAIDGTIKAGEKMTGELGYEVLKGAQTFDLAIIPDPLSSMTKIATIEIPMNIMK